MIYLKPKVVSVYLLMQAEENTFVQWKLAKIYRKNGKCEQAIPLFQQVADRFPKHRAAYDNLGYCHESLKQHDKAIEFFKKATEIQPDSSYAWYGIGFAYMKQKQYEKALGPLTKAVELDPGSEDTREDLCTVQTALNKNEDCIQNVESFIRIYKFHRPQLMKWAFIASHAIGNREKERRYLEMGLKNFPGDYFLNYEMALWEAKAGQITEAKKRLPFLENFEKNDSNGESSPHDLKKLKNAIKEVSSA